jgi:hypothetical protein
MEKKGSVSLEILFIVVVGIMITIIVALKAMGFFPLFEKETNNFEKELNVPKLSAYFNIEDNKYQEEVENYFTNTMSKNIVVNLFSSDYLYQIPSCNTCYIFNNRYEKAVSIDLSQTPGPATKLANDKPTLLLTQGNAIILNFDNNQGAIVITNKLENNLNDFSIKVCNVLDKTISVIVDDNNVISLNPGDCQDVNAQDSLFSNEPFEIILNPSANKFYLKNYYRLVNYNLILPSDYWICAHGKNFKYYDNGIKEAKCVYKSYLKVVSSDDLFITDNRDDVVFEGEEVYDLRNTDFNATTIGINFYDKEEPLTLNYHSDDDYYESYVLPSFSQKIIEIQNVNKVEIYSPLSVLNTTSLKIFAGLKLRDTGSVERGDRFTILIAKDPGNYIPSPYFNKYFPNYVSTDKGNLKVKDSVKLFYNLEGSCVLRTKDGKFCIVPVYQGLIYIDYSVLSPEVLATVNKYIRENLS